MKIDDTWSWEKNIYIYFHIFSSQKKKFKCMKIFQVFHVLIKFKFFYLRKFLFVFFNPVLLFKFTLHLYRCCLCNEWNIIFNKKLINFTKTLSWTILTKEYCFPHRFSSLPFKTHLKLWLHCNFCLVELWLQVLLHG